MQKTIFKIKKLAKLDTLKKIDQYQLKGGGIIEDDLVDFIIRDDVDGF